MPQYSDTNGFPEAGFPVLADNRDNICLNTLYWAPLIAANLKIDIVGNARIVGTMTGITSLTIAGALAGATTIGASGTVTLSSATAPLTLSGASAVLSMTGQNATFMMTGLAASIGTPRQQIPFGYFKNLEVRNPETQQNERALILSDLSTVIPYTGALENIDLGTYDLTTSGAVKAVHKCADGTASVANGTYVMGLKLTPGGTDGSITLKDGIITAITQAT